MQVYTENPLDYEVHGDPWESEGCRAGRWALAALTVLLVFVFVLLGLYREGR